MNTEIVNARITGARWENEIVLTHWIFLEGNGWGCGFGGYSLENIACFEWITQIMKILEITNFTNTELIGKIVRVKTSGWGGKVVAIGHPIKDIWFNPDKHFRECRDLS